MDIEELFPHRLVAYGSTLLKVSSIYNGYITAQVVYPVPPRTTVRAYLPQQIMGFKEPGNTLVERYERAYRLPKVRS